MARFNYLLLLTSLLIGLALSPAENARAQKKSIPASFPVTLDMELIASPGSSTGTLNISFRFLHDVTNARVVYYQPREMPLIFEQAVDFRAGDSLVLWQGDSEALLVREFSYTVPVVTDQILQTSVYASFDKGERYMKDPWYRWAIFYLDTGNDILKANNPSTVRRKQIEREIQQKGYAGLDKYEIRELDRDLYWDLLYPFEKPQPDTNVVIAPDGTPLQFIRLPVILMDTVPDSRKWKYRADADQVLARYQALKQSQRKLVLPNGFRYSDLPDSVAMFQDNPIWSAEEREAAYDAYRERIKHWLRAYWPPKGNE